MKDIDHSGVVIKSENNKVYVKITSKSACSECHAKQACGVSDTADKIIEVTTLDFEKYKEHENVVVSISQKTGGIVVMLAYVIPTIIIVTILLILSAIGVEDNISGVVTLAFTGLYFFILFLFKSRINNKIKTTIKK